MTTCAHLLDAGETSNGQWGWGVGLSLFACVASVLGLDLQRLSHQREARRPAEQRRRAIKQPLNIIGVALLILSSIVDFFAFGFAPQSLLAPLGAVTLVLNILIAPFFLKEKPSKQDIVATVLTFAGVTLAVIFGSTKTKIYTFADLKCLFFRTEFIVYAICITGMLVGCCVLIFKMERDRKNRRPLYPPEFNAEEGEVDTRSRSRKLMDSLKFRAYRAVYPAAAGTVGGGSVLFGKASIELMHSSIAHVGPNPFTTEFMPYLIILIMIVCLVLQGRFLNRGLALYASLFVVPVYQVFWVLIGILGGAVYFDDLRGLSETKAGLYAFGVLLAIGGIVVLAAKKVKREGVSAASGIDESVVLDVIDPEGRVPGLSGDGAGDHDLIEEGKSDSEVSEALIHHERDGQGQGKRRTSEAAGNSPKDKLIDKPGKPGSPKLPRSPKLKASSPRLKRKRMRTDHSSESSPSSLPGSPALQDNPLGVLDKNTKANPATARESVGKSNSSSRSADGGKGRARRMLSSKLTTHRDPKSPDRPPIPARVAVSSHSLASPRASSVSGGTPPGTPRDGRRLSGTDVPRSVPALPTELGHNFSSPRHAVAASPERPSFMPSSPSMAASAPAMAPVPAPGSTHSSPPRDRGAVLAPLVPPPPAPAPHLTSASSVNVSDIDVGISDAV